MSTDNPQPTGPTPDGAVPPAQGTAVPPEGTTSYGTPSGPGWTPVGEDAGEQPESFFERHSNLLISVSAAVIVAAIAVTGLFLWRSAEDDRNADTAAAVTDFIGEQGGEVETIECDGDTCHAVVDNQAYTVLVQEDEDGDQHFGLTGYTGD